MQAFDEGSSGFIAPSCLSPRISSVHTLRRIWSFRARPTRASRSILSAFRPSRSSNRWLLWDRSVHLSAVMRIIVQPVVATGSTPWCRVPVAAEQLAIKGKCKRCRPLCLAVLHAQLMCAIVGPSTIKSAPVRGSCCTLAHHSHWLRTCGHVPLLRVVPPSQLAPSKFPPKWLRCLRIRLGIACLQREPGCIDGIGY